MPGVQSPESHSHLHLASLWHVIFFIELGVSQNSLLRMTNVLSLYSPVLGIPKVIYANMYIQYNEIIKIITFVTFSSYL